MPKRYALQGNTTISFAKTVAWNKLVWNQKHCVKHARIRVLSNSYFALWEENLLSCL